MPRLLNALGESRTVKRNRIKLRRDGDVQHVAGPGVAGAVTWAPLETVIRRALTGLSRAFAA